MGDDREARHGRASNLATAIEVAETTTMRVPQSGVLEKVARIEAEAKERAGWQHERAARERERQQRERAKPRGASGACGEDLKIELDAHHPGVITVNGEIIFEV